jgi:hypothetical protein
MGGHCLRWKLLTVSVEVSSDSQRVIQDLGRLLSHFDSSREKEVNQAEARFSVATGDENGRFRLVCNGKERIRTHSYPYLLALLEHEICMQVIQRERRHLLIHAGGAARGRLTCLFPGEREAGKTTLIAYLLTKDFVGFCDDAAAVDLRTLEVVPFFWPLRIKGDGRNQIGLQAGRLKLGWYGPDPQAYPVRYLMPKIEQIAKKPHRIRLVIFPRYRPGSKARVEELSGAQAASGLIRHSFNFFALGDGGFDAVAELARQTRSYRMEYSDLDEALGLVSELAG